MIEIEEVRFDNDHRRLFVITAKMVKCFNIEISRYDDKRDFKSGHTVRKVFNKHQLLYIPITYLLTSDL